MNKHNINNLLLFIFVLLFSFSLYSQEQVTIVVKDSEGTPVAGAAVIIGEDSKAIYTNDKGEFLMPVGGRDLPVLIEAQGFESKVIRLSGMQSVELTRMPFHMGESDNVHVPFGVLKNRQLAGAVSVLDPKGILLSSEEKSVGGLLNGRLSGLMGSTNIRGIGSGLIVINGVPRQAVDINPHEIDQVTVLKDLSTAMLYGSQAANGVIMITTRRGSVLKNELNFTLESGINVPVSYPEYLAASDYMELYNEARLNDGFEPKYSQMQIDSTRSGLNRVRFPDEGYYNSTFLKDFSSYRNFMASVIRGNETGRFYLNVGWDHSNGLLKTGRGTDEHSDRLSMRSNIDFKVTDIVNLAFDASVIFKFSQSPRYTGNSDFWTISTTFLPDIFPSLIPVTLLTDASMADVAKLIDGKYVLGGTSEYMTNLYGEWNFNGARRSSDRLIELNTGLNFNLNSITEGLTARAYLLFDMYNTFNEDMLNSYAVYRPNYTDNTLTSFTKYGSDVKVDTRSVTDAYFYRKFGSYATIDYNRKFGDHHLNAVLLGYLDEYTVESVRQPLKHGHLGFRGNYIYHDRYIAELTGTYAISGKLLKTENPCAFSPGIGLGWVISEEDFLCENTVINYLKFRTNWALLNTDENLSEYNLGWNYYTSSTSYPYNDGGYTNASRLLYTGNRNIGWEKVSNFNIGFESSLLDFRLGLEGSYFYNKNYDLIVRRSNSLPDFFGNLPYENYGSQQVQGVELGLNYIFTRKEDIYIQFGSNFIYSVPKQLIVDELQYPDKYRQRTGKPTDAYFGYVALGLFKDQADIDGHAVQTFGTVAPGDIKYDDLNKDGIIDEDDQKMIGNSRARYEYGLNFLIRYKSFELFALGTGQIGQERIFNNSYYWIYGDRKYSTVVWDRWTPATFSTATYPRLSSVTNANNFRSSTFWMEKNNWFKLHTLQLTYTVNNLDFFGLDVIRCFLRGSNLLNISPLKEKTDLNVGSSPQMRVYSLGLNLNF